MILSGVEAFDDEVGADDFQMLAAKRRAVVSVDLVGSPGAGKSR
jgi:hypothetical protein